MPEGHSIHRAARRIRAAIGGAVMERVEARGPDLVEVKAEQRLAGSTLVETEAQGKHLLLHFSSGCSVHSHLRMDGAWHVYREGERWKKGSRRAWLVLGGGGWLAVNFDGPILELHPTEELRRDSRLLRLGPDILGDAFNDDEYLRRLRRNHHLEIGEAVMRQDIVAGIGNIYKNESLFLSGTSPWRRIAELDDDELLAIRTTATRIMTDGILDSRTITYTGPGRPGQWVYGREAKPCRRCGRELSSCKQGVDQRITWWCASCQG